jgi:CheY-like chemotaxis protein
MGLRLKGRILLAEDTRAFQRIISVLLCRAGAEVTVVENGQLAVMLALSAAAQGRPFDLILMDIQMPLLDGYGATQVLRELKYPGPIVAVSSDGALEACQRCLDAGCDDFIAKPIDAREIVEVVARNLRPHSNTIQPGC